MHFLVYILILLLHVNQISAAWWNSWNDFKNSSVVKVVASPIESAKSVYNWASSFFVSKPEVKKEVEITDMPKNRISETQSSQKENIFEGDKNLSEEFKKQSENLYEIFDDIKGKEAQSNVVEIGKNSEVRQNPFVAYAAKNPPIPEQNSIKKEEKVLKGNCPGYLIEEFLKKQSNEFIGLINNLISDKKLKIIPENLLITNTGELSLMLLASDFSAKNDIMLEAYANENILNKLFSQQIKATTILSKIKQTFTELLKNWPIDNSYFILESIESSEGSYKGSELLMDNVFKMINLLISLNQKNKLSCILITDQEFKAIFKRHYIAIFAELLDGAEKEFAKIDIDKINENYKKLMLEKSNSLKEQYKLEALYLQKIKKIVDAKEKNLEAEKKKNKKIQDDIKLIETKKKSLINLKKEKEGAVSYILNSDKNFLTRFFYSYKPSYNDSQELIEKSKTYIEESSDSKIKNQKNLDRLAGYEKELKDINDEINKLTDELSKLNQNLQNQGFEGKLNQNNLNKKSYNLLDELFKKIDLKDSDLKDSDLKDSDLKQKLNSFTMQRKELIPDNTLTRNDLLNYCYFVSISKYIQKLTNDPLRSDVIKNYNYAISQNEDIKKIQELIEKAFLKSDLKEQKIGPLELNSERVNNLLKNNFYTKDLYAYLESQHNTPIIKDNNLYWKSDKTENKIGNVNALLSSVATASASTLTTLNLLNNGIIQQWNDKINSTNENDYKDIYNNFYSLVYLYHRAILVNDAKEIKQNISEEFRKILNSQKSIFSKITGIGEPKSNISDSAGQIDIMNNIAMLITALSSFNVKLSETLFDKGAGLLNDILEKPKKINLNILENLVNECLSFQMLFATSIGCVYLADYPMPMNKKIIIQAAKKIMESCLLLYFNDPKEEIISIFDREEAPSTLTGKASLYIKNFISSLKANLTTTIRSALLK